MRPRLDLVAGTEIETDRGILVNERLETSVPGVYAAGDVAQVHDPLTGRAQLDVLWPVAVTQGRVAGANMAGVPTTYDRGVPFNVTRLAGLLVTLIGAVGTRGEADADLLTISRGDSEVWRGVPNAIVVPYLVLGGTDARHYARLSDNVYRFSPYRMGTEALELAHGTNERIGVAEYGDLVRFFIQLIRNSAL